MRHLFSTQTIVTLARLARRHPTKRERLPKMNSETTATQRQILQAIRQRYVARQPLNLTAVKRDDPDLVRQVYSQRPYWGWKAALADAGLSYENIRIEILQYVICQLCGKRYCVLARHLRTMHEIEPREYVEEYPGAALVSEQFRVNQMRSRKKNDCPDWLPHWEPVYSAEYLLDRLHEYAERGYYVNYDNFQQFDSPLPSTLLHYAKLDNWDDAIRAIDLDPLDYRGFTRDDDYVLADFQAWLADRERQQKSCLYQDVAAERNEFQRRPTIVVWAIRRYGNWAAALKAAGVDRSLPIYGHRYGFSTAADVIARIKQLRQEGVPLSRKSIAVLPDGLSLAKAAVRDFGTWEAALDAAKVPKKERRRHVWFETSTEVLEGIRIRIEHDWSLQPYEMFFGCRSDSILFKQAFRFWDSWADAVEAAGGNAVQMVAAKDTPFGTKAKVVAELKRRRKQGKLLARRELTDSSIDKQLYLMASGLYGKWQNAVRAAGVNPREYHQWNLESPGKYKSGAAVLKAIRQRHRQKLPLHTRGITDGDAVDTPLLLAGRKYFGSWSAAIKAANIDYSQIVRKQQDYEAMRGRVYRRYNSKEEVRTEIKRRYAAKLPVTHRGLAHSTDFALRDNALLNAGKKFFGDWDSALKNAGINLLTIRPAWVQVRSARLREKAKRERQ